MGREMPALAPSGTTLRGTSWIASHTAHLRVRSRVADLELSVHGNDWLAYPPDRMGRERLHTLHPTGCNSEDRCGVKRKRSPGIAWEKKIRSRSGGQWLHTSRISVRESEVFLETQRSGELCKAGELTGMVSHTSSLMRGCSEAGQFSYIMGPEAFGWTRQTVGRTGYSHCSVSAEQEHGSPQRGSESSAGVWIFRYTSRGAHSTPKLYDR